MLLYFGLRWYNFIFKLSPRMLNDFSCTMFIFSVSYRNFPKKKESWLSQHCYQSNFCKFCNYDSINDFFFGFYAWFWVYGKKISKILLRTLNRCVVSLLEGRTLHFCFHYQNLTKNGIFQIKQSLSFLPRRANSSSNINASFADLFCLSFSDVVCECIIVMKLSDFWRNLF